MGSSSTGVHVHVGNTTNTTNTTQQNKTQPPPPPPVDIFGQPLPAKPTWMSEIDYQVQMVEMQHSQLSQMDPPPYISP